MIEPENPDVSLYHLSAVVHVVLVSEPQDLLIVTWPFNSIIVFFKSYYGNYYLSKRVSLNKTKVAFTLQRSVLPVGQLDMFKIGSIPT